MGTRRARRLRAAAVGIAVAAATPFVATQAVHSFLDRKVFDPGDSAVVTALFAMAVALCAMVAVLAADRRVLRDGEGDFPEE